MPQNKLLVTGGYGFIGGNFIRFLRDNFPDSYIVNIDKNRIRVGFLSPDFHKDHSITYFIKRVVVERID